ncbi:MAG TPA: ATP-binding protein [Bryobacteraceae bacterium]|nr:ATP-binding protein [Bryobacteraceae bacterium]
MSWRMDKAKAAVMVKAVLLVVCIALIDWRVDLNLSFGFLYLFPILLLGTVLPVWQILLAVLLCTVLADLFDPFPMSLVVLPQDVLVFAALLGAGLVSHQVSRRRRAENRMLRQVERESSARQEAEQQLEFLIDNSPAAIVTMNATGEILLANPAARRLFGVADQELAGRHIRAFVPALAGATSVGGEIKKFRTEMQCRGRKMSGEMFLANVFFSTYHTQTGPRLAALIVDASEELREREESSLQQVLAGSRILAAAVSHEIRNVCGAISVIHENLTRHGALNGNKDFEALGSLVEALSRIASLELRQSGSISEGGAVDLREVLDDLRIVLESYCDDAGIRLSWHIPDELPLVWADRHRLLQVLLNLTKNSERALSGSPLKKISFRVNVSAALVNVQVADTGPGLPVMDNLFQPFQRGANATGLGLYLSRELMRSLHGDLRHEPGNAGCSFIIDLLRADSYDATSSATLEEDAAHSPSVA